MRSRSRLSLALVGGALAGWLSCTDAGLYQWRKDPYQANKLTVSGTVCTDDPHQRNFPVKILFMIDTSSQLMSEKNDPFGNRGRAVEEIVSVWGKAPNYSFGILSFGPKARNLIDTGFSRDATKLDAAIAMIKGSGGIASPCIGGRCRDLRAAFSLASSIITGDLLSGDPGEIARTTYVLVLFAGGPPVPPMGRCPCRDKGTDEKLWGKCTWTDCDGCKVKCPASAICDGNTCYPYCTVEPDNHENNGCPEDQYCDSDYLCKTADGGTPSGKPITLRGWDYKQAAEDVCDRIDALERRIRDLEQMRW